MRKTDKVLTVALLTIPLAIACGGNDEEGPSGDGDGDGSGAAANGDGDNANGDGDGDSGPGDGDGDNMGGSPPLEVGDGWPAAPNDYSWDGSWEPTEEPQGLYDSIYFDGHPAGGSPSPILPPGEWDWQGTAVLANWNNFESNVGSFELLSDNDELAFGWRLNRAVETGVDVDAVMQYYFGSSGTDIIDFGPDSSFRSTGNLLHGPVVGLGDGPDMLRYISGLSASIRLGSTATGSQQDNDLALLGSSQGAAVDTYDITTTTIHTGPGSDLVFVNNFERAAIDLGNGNDGRTDALDPQDGPDIAVIGGNARDFRVFGGRGNDTFVWLVDEVKVVKDSWLGPNFFGGGGWGDALWNDEGTDRLILGIPEDTPVVQTTSENVPGSLLVMVETDQGEAIDTPTENDPYARYYGYVKEYEGHRTVTLQYKSADGSIDTAYFYITAVEEIQVGVSSNAPIYKVDDITGTATLDESLEHLSKIPSRAEYEGLMQSFLK